MQPYFFVAAFLAVWSSVGRSHTPWGDQDTQIELEIEADYVLRAKNGQFAANVATSGWTQVWDGAVTGANIYGLRLTNYDYDVGGFGYRFNCDGGLCGGWQEPKAEMEISDVQGIFAGETVRFTQDNGRMQKAHYEVAGDRWEQLGPNMGSFPTPWWVDLMGATEFRYHLSGRKLVLNPLNTRNYIIQNGEKSNAPGSDWNWGLAFTIWFGEGVNHLKAELVESGEGMYSLCQKGALTLKTVPFKRKGEDYSIASLENVKIKCKVEGRWKCSAPFVGPKHGQCDTIFKNPPKGTVQSDACIYHDKDIKTLPTVSPEKTYEVYSLRHSIIGDGSEAQRKFSDQHKMFHSSLGISETCLSGNQVPSEREGFYIEFFGIHMDQGLFIPDITSNNISWHSTAYIGWYKGFDEKYWDTSPDGILYIGTASGSQVNSFMQKVPQWAAQHPVWSLVSFFDSTDQTKIYVPDSVCHSFVEWSLNELYKAGADFGSMQSPVCRNYVPLYVDSTPTLVDSTDKSTFQDIVTFYENLGKHLKECQQDGGLTFACEKSAYEWMTSYKHAYAAVYKDNAFRYYRGQLASPWAGVSTNQVLQRMFDLAWQTSSVKKGECDFRPNTQVQQILI